MSLLFKTSRNSSSSIVTTLSNYFTARPFSSTFTNSKSLLFNNNNNNNATTSRSDLSLTFNRHIYTFRLTNKLTRNKRTTRPKRTNDSTLPLNYEQAQFAEKIGVNKSWNSWNTSNLLEGKRQAESAFEDYLIRKFLFGTFHGLFSSEIIVKRRFNTINIGFLIKLPKGFYPQQVYFLVGYAETLLSSLLKCVVKVQPQTIANKNDLIFRYW